MAYLSLQGKVFMGERDASGNPLGLIYLGNVPDLKVSLSTSTLEHKESTSGQRLVDLQIITEKKGELACTLEELNAENLKLILYGTTTAQGSGTVTAEVLPNPVTVGSLYLLAKQNVSGVVIKDSTGTPKTLPAGQYTVRGEGGSLIINDKTTGGPYVEPFKADYSYAAASATSMFTQPQPERWLRFEGVNTADGNAPVVVDLYKVAIQPTADFGLIHGEELAKYELKGMVLADTSKAADGELGQFGRIVQITA